MSAYRFYWYDKFQELGKLFKHQSTYNRINIIEISSIAIDILVDLLEHFLESFFKIMKNLKTMNLFDVQDVNNKSLAGAPANFYNNEVTYLNP